MKKISILLFIFIISVLIAGFNARAQEEASPSITASDLGVGEPKTLPNSPFYFLKTFQRQLRLALTFNQVKKAELRLQFANEMLAEAQKLAEKTGNQELFQKAIDKYQKQIEKIQSQVEKFKDDDKEDIKIDSFVDRFNKKIELHQQILEKLQEKLATGSQAFESVQKAQQKVIQHLNQVGEKLRERFQNREKKCENLCGDNQCQEIVCQAIGCPCAETKATCPQDCKPSCLKENNCCLKNEDCKYIWYAGGCNTPEYVKKAQEEAEKTGMRIGEDWSKQGKTGTCVCENNQCVTRDERPQ